MCLWYGHNPEAVGAAEFANSYLRGRASQCPREYESLQAAWIRLLEPHVRNRNSSSGSSTNNNPRQNPAQSDSNRVW
jgi:hypothetical protein